MAKAAWRPVVARPGRLGVALGGPVRFLATRRGIAMPYPLGAVHSHTALRGRPLGGLAVA